MIIPKTLSIGALQTAFRSGSLNPEALIRELLHRIHRQDDPAVWISRFDDEQLIDAARALGTRPGDDQPLWGIPFAVKDNLDVAGLPTTAACPEFSYQPAVDAEVVARLRAAGALVIGKTNLDQFATGLNGTRSPYGAPRCVYNRDYISGGSSSGSAVAVAAGLASFALGSDTAGSGRVPAAFNNLVGLKPTRGWLSTRGLVPACRSLDCVSVFALDVDDAEAVAMIAGGFDPDDVYSRVPPVLPTRLRGMRFGVPATPEWFADEFAAAAWQRCCEQLRAMGAILEPLDYGVLHEIAALLYDGPWVTERFVATETFLDAHAEAMNPIVRGIIEQGRGLDAAAVFRGEYRLRALRRKAEQLSAGVDALLMPSTPTIYTVAEMNADPLRLNSRLGHYTNFVNLLDGSALALPAGFRADGLPFGITVVGTAWQDRALADFGRRWLQHLHQETPRTTPSPPAQDVLRLAVVGAHLRGMPLNRELTDLGASFVEATTTSADYRLYALAGTMPPKPGLARSDGGAPIEVELWDLPRAAFGDFIAGVPAPLGIGSLTLLDGRQVKGFICEPWALADATDITSYGGWRAYRAAAA